tara:strand:+ start:1930 stop:2340 length:411 start_codon:yes stop_codon:yes gene_type:complete
MDSQLKFRPLKESDYETICSWWKWWRWPEIPRDMLPDSGKSGFMVYKNKTPIVSCFLFITNSKGAKLEWVVSNPKYKEKDRKQAIEMLINKVEEVCRNMGYKYIFSIGRNKHLINTHKKLGWLVDKKPSYEIIKTI